MCYPAATPLTSATAHGISAPLCPSDSPPPTRPSSFQTPHRARRNPPFHPHTPPPAPQCSPSRAPTSPHSPSQSLVLSLWPRVRPRNRRCATVRGNMTSQRPTPPWHTVDSRLQSFRTPPRSEERRVGKECRSRW